MTTRAAVFVLALALATGLGACSSGPAADSPAGVVRTAVDLAAKKDVAGLKALSCAGQEATIARLVGLPLDLGAAIVPGVDLQAVLDAVRLDVGGVKVGDAAVNGDEATVPVGGSLKVTFDAATMRPILEKVMAARGSSMTSDQLDALVQGLAAYGQDVPLDQKIQLVREGGAWKVCMKELGPIASPGPSR